MKGGMKGWRDERVEGYWQLEVSKVQVAPQVRVPLL
jgi:hypothetical protein